MRLRAAIVAPPTSAPVLAACASTAKPETEPAVVAVPNWAVQVTKDDDASRDYSDPALLAVETGGVSTSGGG